MSSTCLSSIQPRLLSRRPALPERSQSFRTTPRTRILVLRTTATPLRSGASCSSTPTVRQGRNPAWCSLPHRPHSVGLPGDIGNAVRGRRPRWPAEGVLDSSSEERVQGDPRIWGSALRAILGFLFGAEFLDGGGHVVLPGELFILGRVVGRQIGNLRAELLQQGAGFVQFVAPDIRLAIRPGPLVGRVGVLRRPLAVADGKPQVREGAV